MKAKIVLKSFPGHAGIPGHQGGSLPMGADKGGGEGGQSASKGGTAKATKPPFNARAVSELSKHDLIKFGSRSDRPQYGVHSDEVIPRTTAKAEKILSWIEENADTFKQSKKFMSDESDALNLLDTIRSMQRSAAEGNDSSMLGGSDIRGLDRGIEAVVRLMNKAL